MLGIRFKNLLAFDDTGWLELRPITFLYGLNSSGKSAISNALGIVQDALGVRERLNKLHNLGITSFSKACFNADKSQQIAIGFHCQPGLGLMSKVGEFSNLLSLDIQEDETVVLQVIFDPSIPSPSNDFGSISSIQLTLHESRTIKDETTGNWVKKDVIISIDRSKAETEKWLFFSDFLDLQSAIEILEQITLDDAPPFPMLKAKEGNLYDLLRIELTQEQAEDENYDPYKVYDNPKNIVRYINSFLQTLSSDIVGYLDAITVVKPSSSGSNLSDFSHLEKYETDYMRIFLESFRGISALGNMNSNTGMKELIHKLFMESNTESEALLGIGLTSSLKMMFELSNLKRDSIVFIHHPDAYLDNKTQLLLADFLVAHALDVENNKTLIIETHSENFLLRIQKRLKQINEKRLPTDLSFLKDNLSQEKIAVIVVVRAQNESSKCFRISLDESGDMREPWPVGFFEEGFVERFVI